MNQRAIVRDADIATAKQWRFEGTNILVSEVKRDYQARQERSRAAYRALGLTDAEIDAALAFELPPIADLEISPYVVAFEVQCVCGERRRTIARPPTWETDHCICGRTWRITVGIESGQSDPTAVKTNGGS